MQWYKVIGARGHVGAGRYVDSSLYIKAKSITDAMMKCKGVPMMKGIRIRKHRSSRVPSPTIRLASRSELESTLMKDPNFDPHKHWFYFTKPNYTP